MKRIYNFHNRRQLLFPIQFLQSKQEHYCDHLMIVLRAMYLWKTLQIVLWRFISFFVIFWNTVQKHVSSNLNPLIWYIWKLVMKASTHSNLNCFATPQYNLFYSIGKLHLQCLVTAPQTPSISLTFFDAISSMIWLNSHDYLICFLFTVL